MREPHRPVDGRPDFPQIEERVLERWREERTFERALAQREDGPVFSFIEGPPTANGNPGSHHVLLRSFKDFYMRYRTMCGYRVPRKAGWDCHGLPVELEVEKQLGFDSKREIEEYGIAAFNERCRESNQHYIRAWERMTERVGFWIDLENAFQTGTPEYIESVWWSLHELWDRGLIYEGHKVVPYCPRCGTGALLARGRDGLPRDRGPDRDGQAARRRAARAAAGGRRLPDLDDAAVDAVRQLRRRDRARRPLRARQARRRGLRAGGGARRGDARRGGRRDPRPLPGPHDRRRPLRAAVRPAARPRPAQPHRARRRPRHARQGHRPRPHRDGVRRGGLRPLRAPRDPARQPGPRGRHLRRADRRLGGRVRRRRDAESGRGAARRRQAAGGGAVRRTPTRTAGAATPSSSTTRRRAGTSPRATAATTCCARTRGSTGAPSTCATAASATGCRATSTGRSHATATGARRCRSGSARRRRATRATASARSTS